MSEPNPKRQLLLMERLWSHWTDAVAQCLRRRTRLRDISPTKYRILHSHLLRELEEGQVLASAEVLRCGSELEELAEFCRPWISLEALQSTERRMLMRVLEQSRKLAFKAFGKRALRRGVSHAATWIAAASVLTIFVAGLVGRSVSVSSETSLRTTFRREVYRLWRVFEQFSGQEWLVVAVGLVLVVGIWMLYTPKRY